MLSKDWEKLSERERRLALLTGLLLLAMVLYFVVVQAKRHLSELDQRVDQLEEELYTDTELVARSEQVDGAYGRLAEEHSSQWSKEEIHDRLRQEMDRLARKVPPAPGAIASSDAAGDYLVKIPSIPFGHLNEGGADYREYLLSLKVAPSPVTDVVEYLKRIQESPQLLRIDGLQLRRAAESGAIEATIDVTRAVVKSVIETPRTAPPEEGAPDVMVRNAGFEQWSDDGANAVDWDGIGCTLSASHDSATEGSTCLQALCQGDIGSISQRQELAAGEVYELRVDLGGSGTIRLGVAGERDGKLFEGAETVPSDSALRHYVVRFTAPGTPGGGSRVVRAPYVELEGQGAKVVMDHVELVKVSE